jgi:hypothetical protein
VHRHAVPRTDVRALDQWLPLRLAERSRRRRELARGRNSSFPKAAVRQTQQAPTAARARKQGRRGDPSRRRGVDAVEMRTFGEYEVRCFARVETRFHVRASMLRLARLRDRLCLQAVASTADLRVGRTAPLASQATTGQSTTRRTPLSRARLPPRRRGDPSRSPDRARAVRVRRASNSRCDDRAQTGNLRRTSWPARSDPPMDPGPPGRRH